MRVWLVIALLATAWLHGLPAHACGPQLPAYATLVSISPSDGTENFPRDGAVGVRVKRWVSQSTPDAAVEIRLVRADDGAEITGYVSGLTSISGVIAWAPNEPLEANTRYRIEVRTTPTPRADIDAPTIGSSTFTTSDASSPPIRLEGALGAKLFEGTAPVKRCEMCGECKVIGERPALYAEVEVPRVLGGYAELGYQAWLTLNDAAAATFDGPGEGKKSRGSSIVDLATFLELEADETEPRRVTIELPRESTPWEACFGFNAWDRSGHAEHAEPLCIPARELESAFEALDAEQNPTEPEAHGCAVAFVGRALGVADVIWLAATLFLALLGARTLRRVRR